MPFRWTPEQIDRLERAARDGRRVAVMRHGGEIVVVARRLVSRAAGDTLVAWLPMTGEEIDVPLAQIEHFSVVDA